VLGIFFLLVWVTVIAALTSHDRSSRARLLLPGQVDDEFKGAMLRHDHAQLARYYRVALGRSLPSRDEQLIRINLACALNGLGEHKEALEELDRVGLGELQPAEVALWLNNRAYTLIFLGRAVDALDNLSDADELLAGDDALSRDPLLAACISGTRGIALYHKGDLEAGEKALLLALRQEEDGVALQFDPEWQVDPARSAERWFWLGEIARSRGDASEARRRFERAAAYSATEFGGRAKVSLGGLLEAGSGPRGLLAAATVNPAKTST
jgi:tetratricopeptide (TPR) repeat protein